MTPTRPTEAVETALAAIAADASAGVWITLIERTIALDEANRSGRIKQGDYVLMVVFGGGLTWASTIVEW